MARVKGAANRSTLNARAAIGALVDGNIHRLEGWLDAIAEDPDQGPMAAWKCMMDVIEYHVPKLARFEHAGAVELKTPPSDPVELARGVAFLLAQADAVLRAKE